MHISFTQSLIQTAILFADSQLSLENIKSTTRSAYVLPADSGVSQPDEPSVEAWQLGMPFSVETKEGHAEACLSPVIMPNPLRKASNALQVLATPAWPL